MGSELLTDVDENEGGSGDSESPFFIAKMLDDCFPYYLSLGMTPAEYWDGDNDLVIAYRKAADIKAKRKNTERWLMGQYVYDGIMRLLPAMHTWKPRKPERYVEEPYPLTKAEIEERKLRDAKKEQEKIREQLLAAMNVQRVKML